MIKHHPGIIDASSMHHPRQPAPVRPHWSSVLRGLREARGVTQDGWAALLGFGRATVQRWERGEAAPGADATNALVTLCREQGLLRTFERGRLRGLTVTADLLRELLAEARLGAASAVFQPVVGRTPSAAAAGPSSNFPTPVTRIVGREKEIAHLQRLLGTTRLVTLTGPGGSGKTRLALEMARTVAGQFRDGVFFVSLESLTDPALVAGAIARALGLREAPNEPFGERLKDHLRNRQMLLVLDNFERIAPAAPLVAEILAHAPHLTVLATSRSVLRLRGETRFGVPPLSLPGPDRVAPAALLAQSAAVSLFVERAQEVASGFALTDENSAAVAAICVRLDGLPLAIELAAPRIQILTPRELLARLEMRPGGSSLPLLTGTARDLPARQRTLRATIAWSYSLLDDTEQALFRGLAIFVGGCTLTAIEAVCITASGPDLAAVDGVASLAENSMVQHLPPRQEAREARVWMLDTIREFALEQLAASGETDSLARRHAMYLVELVEEATRGLRTAEAPSWLARLNDELGNVRAALRWCVEHDEAEAGVRLVWALFRFWQLHGHPSEGARWTEELLRLPGATGTHPIRAKLLDIAGLLSLELGDYAAARSRLEESISASRAADGAATLAHALSALALVLGADSAGRPLIEESVALLRASNDRWTLARTLSIKGFTALWQGDESASWSASAESLSLYRELGDRWYAAVPLYNRALLLQRGGDPLARAAFEESLSLFREMGDNPLTVDVLNDLARLLLREGDHRQAVKLFQEALELSRRLGLKGRCAAVVRGLAVAAIQLGQPEQAARLFGMAEALRETIGAHLPISPQEDDERALAALRARLDDAACRAAWAAGKAMTLDQVLTDRLEVGDVSGAAKDTGSAGMARPPVGREKTLR